jgi:hypothetical protein
MKEQYQHLKKRTKVSTSNSFQDALKKVLVPEKKVAKPLPKLKKVKKRSNYVSEAMNSSSSPTTTTATAGGAAGMPPFSKYSTDANAGSVDMRDIGKQEDYKAKDNNKKPYPLETVLDFIAHSGEDLQNAHNLVIQALKINPMITDEQKKVLKDAQQAISSSLGNVDKSAKLINSIEIN